jgi:hypothetical protein
MGQDGTLWHPCFYTSRRGQFAFDHNYEFSVGSIPAMTERMRTDRWENTLRDHCEMEDRWAWRERERERERKKERKIKGKRQ